MNSETRSKRQPVDTLTHQNWREWFQLIELYFAGEELDFVLHQTEEEYCSVIGFADQYGTSTGVNTPGTEKEGIESLGKTLEGLSLGKAKPQGGRLNIEKQRQFRKASAKVLYTISICIDSLDIDMIYEFATVKEKWDHLRMKYSKVRPQANRDDIAKITMFKLQKGIKIEDAWNSLKSTRTRVVLANDSYRHAFTEEMLFEQLLSGLPDEYSTTRAVIDAQSNLTVQDKLYILTKQEDRLTTDDTQKALAAQMQRLYGPKRQSRQDSGSDSDSYRKLACWACKAKGHLARECPMLSQLQTIVKKLSSASLQSENSRSRETSSLRTGKDKNKSAKGRSTSAKGRKAPATALNRRHKGHVAENESSDADTELSNSDSSDHENDEIEEVAAHSQDLGKVPPSLWVSDTGATAHMTDQRQLFRSLTPVKRRTIRVGGGKLYSWHMGVCELRVPSGRVVLLKDVLFVPKLGVNLLSSQRICSQPYVKGSFDSQRMYFTRGNEKIMRADIQGGIYIVSWLAKGLEETAFYVTAPIETNQRFLRTVVKESSLLRPLQEARKAKLETSNAIPAKSNNDVVNPSSIKHCNHQAYVGDSQSENLSSTDEKRESPETVRKRFELWHRRFAHCDPEKLRYLHKVTDLKQKIQIPSNANRKPCEVCKLSKLRNRIRKELSPWKDSILELISIDACGPLPRTLKGNEYFGQIVDNATRKAWVIPAKSRSDLVRLLRVWKVKVERQTGLQIGAIRIDNATEFKSLLKEWSDEYGLSYQPTVPYKSNQNGIAERTIQRTESDARAMLADARLPIEFWDEATEADTYLRNRLPGGEGLRSETYIFSPEEAFTGKKGQISIEHIRTFGCKCYSYIDPKSLPAYGRKDKLMPRARTCIFMGYVDETTKQYKVYAPDLRTTIRSSVVDFEEETKGGSIDLNLPGEHPQGTPNVLTTRNPVGRPKEPLLLAVTPPPQEKLNNFEIVIPVRTPGNIVDTSEKPTDTPVSPKSNNLEPAKPCKDQEKTSEPAKPIILQEGLNSSLYSLRKRNWN